MLNFTGVRFNPVRDSRLWVELFDYADTPPYTLRLRGLIELVIPSKGHSPVMNCS